MMRLTSQLQVSNSEMRLLVACPEQGDVLKARLPLQPAHPRALLTLLEGIALWSGSRLCVVIAVEPNCPSWLDSGLFGDELWPGESQLVRYEVVARARPKRLQGVGDFRGLRKRSAW
ncbi:MAG: hypothetical protein R3B13_27410 [Polyangiaceae bacterium]